MTTPERLAATAPESCRPFRGATTFPRHADRPATALVLATLVLATLAACTGSPAGPSADPPSASASPSTAELRKPQELPASWDDVPFLADAPRSAPPGDAPMPDLLDDPVPAVLVHHPVETLDDPAGWSGERLFFLGTDGRWRALDMSDLDLPAGTWTGPDMYGAGALSGDGRWWAGHADGGVVLLDLRTGRTRFIGFERPFSRVFHVSWVPGRRALSAYAGRPDASGSRTFAVELDGRVRAADHPGSRTRLDVDGTPVALTRSGRQQLTVTRWTAEGKRSDTWDLDIAIPRLVKRPYGTFGEEHVAFTEQRGDSIAAPMRVWVLDKQTGDVVAGLAAGPQTALGGWTDDGGLRLLLRNRHLVVWHPETGELRRFLEVPGPYPRPGDWAAATVAFPTS